MMGDMSGMGWWGPGFSGIFMILWWGLVILGTVTLVRWLLSLPRGGGADKSALDLLKERYARGDMDRDEFERTRRDIGQ